MRIGGEERLCLLLLSLILYWLVLSTKFHFGCKILTYLSTNITSFKNSSLFYLFFFFLFLLTPPDPTFSSLWPSPHCCLYYCNLALGSTRECQSSFNLWKVTYLHSLRMTSTYIKVWQSQTYSFFHLPRVEFSLSTLIFWVIFEQGKQKFYLELGSQNTQSIDIFLNATISSKQKHS